MNSIRTDSRFRGFNMAGSPSVMSQPASSLQLFLPQMLRAHCPPFYLPAHPHPALLPGSPHLYRPLHTQRPPSPTKADEPKPPQSYIGLIAMAILSSPGRQLVLNDIYQWIIDNYTYFRTKGTGWKNSIRHNLSLNDCFVKMGRSNNGKGHYWSIHPANMEDFMNGDFRRRRAQQRVKRHQVQLQNAYRCDSTSSSEEESEEKVSSENSAGQLASLPENRPAEMIPVGDLALTRKKRSFNIDSLLSDDYP